MSLRRVISFVSPVVLLVVALGSAGRASAQPQPQPSSMPASSAAPAAPASTAPAPSAAASTTPASNEATTPKAPRVLSLAECLEMAEKNHPNIAAARARVDDYRAQLDEAHTAPFSGFSMTAGVGPAPTFRGGSIYTQDREVGLSSSLGMAWQVNASGTIPLWTFGKITNTWAAAEAQVQVGEADIKKQKNLVRQDVRKAYHGLQTARDSLALLEDATSRLDKGIESLKKRIASNDVTVDDIDMYRLKTTRLELEARRSEAQKFDRIASISLRFLTGVEGEFDVPTATAPKHELGSLESYQRAAIEHRPELAMARAGLRAREAQVALAKSKMYPDIGVTLFLNYSRAPEITDQLNPFVRDDANYFRYGLAFGMKWNLDVLPGLARVHQAEAKAAELRETVRYGLGGLNVEIETAYAQALDAKKRSENYAQASKMARQWMVKVSQGLDLGAYAEKDLVEPAKQYALQRYNYLNALMDYNMAIASLALATGWQEITE
ncbi:MAG: TolC family protein [Polyangiaceae bacterium]